MAGGHKGLLSTSLTWNTLNEEWTLLDYGSCNVTAKRFTIFMMGNGLLNLGASFLVMSLSVMSQEESHTFWPTQ